jgi:hypothetical protein
MARIPIEFEWSRDPKGYRFVETKLPKMLCVVRNGTGHGLKDLQSYWPLAKTDTLFGIFANMATSPEGVLEFVRRFGPLTWDGFDAKKGDPVNLVMFNADHMRQVLRIWNGGQKQTQTQLPVGPYQAAPSVSLNAMVVWDPAAKALRWKVCPNTLLDALWLQLGQALTAGVQIRECEHCGEWFYTGRGTDRRLDAKFCSDEHRIAFNSLKRSREK